MPCSDYGRYEDQERADLKEKLDKLTRMLCSVLRAIDSGAFGITVADLGDEVLPEVHIWWQEHKRLDAARNQR